MAAFSRLSPKHQAAVKASGVSFETPKPSVDGTIYWMDRGFTGRPTPGIITTERLDIAAIVRGFNDAFPSDAPGKWSVAETSTCEKFQTPGGVEKHWFALDWTFRNPGGRTVILSDMDAGPGVISDYKPGIYPPFGSTVTGGVASREAVANELNLSFALVFLELVAQMGDGG